MLSPIFITGIGTGVGKTLVAAMVARALQADYWKPIQAGYADGTDSESVRFLLRDASIQVHPETYRLRMAASPHIAAREENKTIDLKLIRREYDAILESAGHRSGYLVIEGAGGLLVPLNESEFVADLAMQLGAKIIIVSRNYLGSINHSLLTAAVCKQYGLPVLGWIFNDQYLAYEDEIAAWSGYPKIGSIPFCDAPDSTFIAQQAKLLLPALKNRL